MSKTATQKGKQHMQSNYDSLLKNLRTVKTSNVTVTDTDSTTL